MHQVRSTGTAWERCLSDYAYTRELAITGWAWEYLRRNKAYQCDVRLNRASHPVAIPHVSGATLFRLRRRLLVAEHWGLTFFIDPTKTALQVSPFWLPHLVTHLAHCETTTANDNEDETLSLAAFAGQRSVLVTHNHEQISFRHGLRCADLVMTQGTFLGEKCVVSFHHKGLNSISRHAETLKTLQHLNVASVNLAPQIASTDSKYRDYLVALDGHLAGRSYRDIAEVLYGRDRVGKHWTYDTRWMKSKVRRAVERGIALMNGGYRALL